MQKNILGFHCHALEHFEPAIIGHGLHRGEFYHFPGGDLPELKQEILRHGLAVSIHAPLVKPPWYPNPPTWSFLCDVEEADRQLTMKMIAETMELARSFKAEYVVVHFPVPLTPSFAEVSYERQHEIAWQSAAELAELAIKNGVAVHLEGFGPSPFLTVEFLSAILTQFPCLRYCFDAGHMNIAAQRDGFHLYRFAERLAPYVGSIHLWNGRSIEDYMQFRHIPVHPSQRPEEGWVDIAWVLRSILPGSPSCPVILESGLRYPQALGNYNISEGVEWVKELVATLS